VDGKSWNTPVEKLLVEPVRRYQAQMPCHPIGGTNETRLASGLIRKTEAPDPRRGILLRWHGCHTMEQ
jgi:hypothetical protein